MSNFPGSAGLSPEGLRLLPELEAQAIARGFDVTALPAGFYDDPYPVYHALRTFAPVHTLASASRLRSGASISRSSP